MDNVLFKYFENRYQDAGGRLNLPNKFGPVITISRQAGCEAKNIASLLVDELNHDTDHRPWKWIDKEVLEASAKELNLNMHKLEHFFEGKEKSVIADIFESFSRSHVNDVKIKNTIKDVILSICKQGHVVLVGRAGAALLQEKPNVLNIRVTAPFYWRVETIMKNRQIGIEEAEEWAIDTDEKRHNLFYVFLDKQPGNLDYLFDATLNRKSFSVNQTCKIIKDMAHLKKII
jgi:cytidylate kinase